MIKINGIEFEVDTMDLEVSEKIENELTKFGECINNVGNTATRKDIIKAVVNATSKVFDNVLGDGASEKIFNGKKSLTLATKCMDEFVTGLREADEKVGEELEKMTKKFSPNRAQRRSKAKK